MSADELGSRRVRGFYQASRYWYFKRIHPDGLEEFNIGVYWIDPSNGTEGEFSLRQHALGNDKPWRMEAFNDSWKTMAEFRDLIDWMASLDRRTASAEEVRTALVALGIVDLTTERSPHSERALAAEELTLRQRLAEIESIRAARNIESIRALTKGKP